MKIINFPIKINKYNNYPSFDDIEKEFDNWLQRDQLLAKVGFSIFVAICAIFIFSIFIYLVYT